MAEDYGAGIRLFFRDVIPTQAGIHAVRNRQSGCLRMATDMDSGLRRNDPGIVEGIKDTLS